MTAKLEHIGIAVVDPAPVRELLSRLLGLSAYKVETVNSEGVDTHFLNAGTAKVELLESIAPDSPIAGFLERRGEGIHHLAFEVPDLEDVLDRAVEMGLTPVSANPKDGADGKRIFFLHPKETHGILIEVCQSVRFPAVWSTVTTSHGDVEAIHLGAQDAPALLFLPDADSAIATSFGTLLARLEPSLRVLAFNTPLSSRGPRIQSGGRGTPDDLIEAFAIGVLDHFGAGVAVVGAAGLDAASAVSLALRSSDRVNGLVLFDPDLPEAEVQRLRSVTVPILIIGLKDSMLAEVLRLHQELAGPKLAVIPDSPDHASALAPIVSNFVATVPK